MEIEYVATSEAAKDVVWCVIPSAQSAITLYCDNSGAVANSKKLRAQKKRRYIEKNITLFDILRVEVR